MATCAPGFWLFPAVGSSVWLLLKMGVYFDVEVTFRLEIRDEIAATFLHQFLVRPHSGNGQFGLSLSRRVRGGGSYIATLHLVWARFMRPHTNPFGTLKAGLPN